MKFQLYLDTANSLGPNNGQALWTLNQAIIGAVSCTVLSLNFINSIPNLGLDFNSTALLPSDKRLVRCLGAQNLSMPFFTHIVRFPGLGVYDTFGSQIVPSTFKMSGMDIGTIDVTVTDSASGAIVSSMTAWNILLEFDVPAQR